MALILLLVIAIVVALPSTWLLMLFLGNLGVNLSFWSCLPGGLLLVLRGVTPSKE